MSNTDITFITTRTGRTYEVNAATGVATLIPEQDGPSDEELLAQAEAERYAEFGMSWVHGGGRAEDVAAAWRQGIR